MVSARLGGFNGQNLRLRLWPWRPQWAALGHSVAYGASITLAA